MAKRPRVEEDEEGGEASNKQTQNFLNLHLQVIKDNSDDDVKWAGAIGGLWGLMTSISQRQLCGLEMELSELARRCAERRRKDLKQLLIILTYELAQRVNYRNRGPQLRKCLARARKWQAADNRRATDNGGEDASSKAMEVADKLRIYINRNEAVLGSTESEGCMLASALFVVQMRVQPVTLIDDLIARLCRMSDDKIKEVADITAIICREGHIEPRIGDLLGEVQGLRGRRSAGGDEAAVGGEEAAGVF